MDAEGFATGCSSKINIKWKRKTHTIEGKLLSRNFELQKFDFSREIGNSN